MPPTRGLSLKRYHSLSQLGHPREWKAGPDQRFPFRQILLATKETMNGLSRRRGPVIQTAFRKELESRRPTGCQYIVRGGLQDRRVDHGRHPSGRIHVQTLMARCRFGVPVDSVGCRHAGVVRGAITCGNTDGKRAHGEQHDQHTPMCAATSFVIRGTQHFLLINSAASYHIGLKAGKQAATRDLRTRGIK